MKIRNCDIVRSIWTEDFKDVPVKDHNAIRLIKHRSGRNTKMKKRTYLCFRSSVDSNSINSIQDSATLDRVSDFKELIISHHLPVPVVIIMRHIDMFLR